ncbi:MAG: FAD:protein FMN transferase [Desulfohalobiaceae bacterium]
MASKHNLTRRECLRYLGALGLGATASGLFLQPGFASSNSQLQQASRVLPLMGTMVRVTIYDPSRDKALQVQEEALQEMQRLIPIFNRFDSQGHLARLNRHKSLQDVPPELDLVLSQAIRLHQASSKSFDITVLPWLEEYEQRVEQTGYPPDPQRARELREALGMDKLQLGPGRVRLLHPEAKLTLDGIAKGYIVDRAAKLIQEQGISHALIDAGGDLRVIGGKDQASPWMIGVQDPRGKQDYAQKLALRDMAVATSGDYQRFFSPGFRHHHLLHPGQDSSPGQTASCTVAAPSAMLADSLSTALFVLPIDKGLELARRFPQAQAHIIQKGGRRFSSQGWSRLLA